MKRLIVFYFIIVSSAATLLEATSNPQHDSSHKNTHLPVRCRTSDGSNVDVNELTDERLASIKSIEGQTPECLKALTMNELDKMPEEFFVSAEKATAIALPITIKLAVLKRINPSERFVKSIVNNQGEFLKILKLAAQDEQANTKAVAQLFKNAGSLSSALFSKFGPEHLPLIPASAFASLTVEQFKALTPSAISAISFAQFRSLRPAAKMAMTVEQAAAFPPEGPSADITTTNLKYQLQCLEVCPSSAEASKLHPCAAVVLSKQLFSKSVMDVLMRRCQFHIIYDAQAILSSQLLAGMIVISLLFIITV